MLVFLLNVDSIYIIEIFKKQEIKYLAKNRLTRSSRLTKPALKSGRLDAGTFCSLTAC